MSQNPPFGSAPGAGTMGNPATGAPAPTRTTSTAPAQSAPAPPAPTASLQAGAPAAPAPAPPAPAPAQALSTVGSGPATAGAAAASAAPADADKKEIYTHEAPWLIYGMNWSVRPDQRFRLAIGSFTEEYTNKVRVAVGGIWEVIFDFCAICGVHLW